MKKEELRLRLVQAVVSAEILAKETPQLLGADFLSQLGGAYRTIISKKAKKSILNDYLQCILGWVDCLDSAKEGEGRKNEVRFELLTAVVKLEAIKKESVLPFHPSFYRELAEAYKAIQLDVAEGVLKGHLELLTAWVKLFEGNKPKIDKITAKDWVEHFADKHVTPQPSEEHLLNKLSTVANIETDPAKVYLAKLLLEDVLTNKDNFALVETVYRNAFRGTYERN